MTRPLPHGARFILTAVFLVATIGLLVLAIADATHGRYGIAIIDAVLLAIAATVSVRVMRPIARTSFGTEEDVFEGSRGILWSIVVLVLIVLLVIVVMFFTSPNFIRGFMDGWRDAGR